MKKRFSKRHLRKSTSDPRDMRSHLDGSEKFRKKAATLENLPHVEEGNAGQPVQRRKFTLDPPELSLVGRLANVSLQNDENDKKLRELKQGLKGFLLAKGLSAGGADSFIQVLMERCPTALFMVALDVEQAIKGQDTNALRRQEVLYRPVDPMWKNALEARNLQATRASQWIRGKVAEGVKSWVAEEKSSEFQISKRRIRGWFDKQYQEKLMPGGEKVTTSVGETLMDYEHVLLTDTHAEIKILQEAGMHINVPAEVAQTCKKADTWITVRLENLRRYHAEKLFPKKRGAAVEESRESEIGSEEEQELINLEDGGTVIVGPDEDETKRRRREEKGKEKKEESAGKSLLTEWKEQKARRQVRMQEPHKDTPSPGFDDEGEAQEKVKPRSRTSPPAVQTADDGGIRDEKYLAFLARSEIRRSKKNVKECAPLQDRKGKEKEPSGQGQEGGDVSTSLPSPKRDAVSPPPIPDRTNRGNFSQARVHHDTGQLGREAVTRKRSVTEAPKGDGWSQRVVVPQRKPLEIIHTPAEEPGPGHVGRRVQELNKHAPTRV